MTRIVPMVVGVFFGLALATEAQATLNACTSAKEACVAKKTAALLKCHSKNSKPPSGLDPAKFAALETQVDEYVDAVICALDPAAGTCPAPNPTPTPGCVANGGACSNASQCCSTACSGNTCVPSCANGFQDGTETGIDCGGSDCPACPLGGGCLTNDDCVATAACSGGMCVCAAGLSDCNANPGDGCETNISTSTSNCGGCNQLCSTPNASPVCSSGQCQIGGCVPGFADCDSIVATGCEVDTDSDDNNCGSCNNVCPGVLNCVNGFCQ